MNFTNYIKALNNKIIFTNFVDIQLNQLMKCQKKKKKKCSKSSTDYHAPYSRKENRSYPCKHCGV